MKVTLYHNPRCSKSRATLALLQSRGIEPNVVEYLKSPPTEAVILDLIQAFGRPPMTLVRTREAEFADSGLRADESDPERVAAAIARWPKLLERPVVVAGKRARIGRPPENVLELL